MTSEKLVEWHQILGNPYRQALHPQMLTEQGYIVRKMGRIEGMGKSEMPIPLVITYRFDYVAAFLSTTVFSRLEICQPEQLLKTVDEAYQEWSKKNASRRISTVG